MTQTTDGQREARGNRAKAWLVVAALVLGGIVVALGINHLITKFAERRADDGTGVTRAQLPADAVPTRFPGDFPQPDAVRQLGNYEAVALDGREQSTRAYVDPRGQAEVAAELEAYFAQAGWTVTSRASLDGYAAFLAVREGVSMQATLNRAPDGNGTSVTLDVADAPPQAS